MKKYFFPLFLFLLFVFSCGAAYFFFGRHSSSEAGPTATIGDVSFSLEVADTDAKRERGLGYRETLCERCGMLFLFDRPDRYGFWMKGMRFPLDILWIREGAVVFLERNLDPNDQTRVFVPSAEADRVLELNAGMADRFGIREGSFISFQP